MRETRILSYALDPPSAAPDGDRVGTNLDHVLQLLDDARAYDPDFVCFPEFVLQLRYRGDGLARTAVARPIPGDATAAVGEKAADLDSYVLLPMIQQAGDAVYNAVALVGRDGEVVGVAHKVAPTVGEMDEGTRPGETIRTWDTPFGRIGVSICWDARYPEVGVRLAERRADLVFHPTTGRASQQFVTWAKYYGYHHVTCDKHDAWITTPTGARIARTSTGAGNPTVEFEGGATARVSFDVVNTDCRTYGLHQNRGVTSAIRERYRGKVAFHAVPEAGNVVVESLADDLTVADIEAAFDLETMFAYEERTRARVFAETDRSPLLPFDR